VIYVTLVFSPFTRHKMLLSFHFTFSTLLVTVALLAPLVIYIIRTNRSVNFNDPIVPVANPMEFDDLAPVDAAEQSDAYMDALRWALGNKKTQNIALTGPYGSGKSSLLATFKKKYPNDFSYLSISLASFSDLANDDTPSTIGASTLSETQNALKANEQQSRHKNEAQQLIELSILQQIFYKVDQAEIPDSRFKRISLVRAGDLNYFIAGVLFFLFGTLSIFFPDHIQKLSLLNDFVTDYPDAWYVLVIGMIAPGLIWLIVTLFRFFRTSGLKKLNISSGEIEIDPNSEASILNKYLDELVYFFSATKFNVVLIEDMDRFNDSEIFTKLRELNTLLNNSSQIKRRIIFIYAIKDDLFEDERTRTKFFDFIIPVIPIINWSNSLEKLKDKLNKGSFEIEPRFVTAITLYIDDMRVLKNIFNELLLYNKTLQIPKERQTKLLAMIVYKNMYPNDFADLHEEKGMVHQIFAQAQTEREKIMTGSDKEIAIKEKEIADAEALVPLNINELRAVYIQAITDKLNNFSYYYLQGERKSFAQMQEDENFEELMTGKNIRYVTINSSSTSANVKITDIEKAIAPGVPYEERQKSVHNKSVSNIARLRAEIHKLKAKRSQIAGYPVSEVIRSQISAFPVIQESVIQNRLLRYLLSEGYIDLSYPYLISYFYPGSIGRADLKFLTSVNDRIALPLEYSLEKPSGLIEMLADYDFEKDAILNVSLLDELLSRRNKLKMLGDRVIAQLSSESERALTFIAAYVDKGAHVPIFVKLLCSQWPGIFTYFADKGDDTITQNYLKLILEHANIDELLQVNTPPHLSNYVNDHFDVVSSFLPGIDGGRMSDILQKLNIKFVQLCPSEKAQALFDLAYDGDHYSIDAKNIQAIIENKNKKELDIANLSTANYSTIIASDCENLYNYIDQEKNYYVENVLLKLSEVLTDNAKDLTDLLNDDDIELTNKQQLITKETVVIDKISDIDDTALHALMYSHNKVKATWGNVLVYFNEIIDEALLQFLNVLENAAALGATSLTPDSRFIKSAIDKLEMAILKENKLSLSAFKSLISALTDSYVDLDTTSLADDKVKELIYSGLLDLTKINYDRTRSNHSPLHVDLLLEHLDEFLNDLEEFEIDNADRLLMLKVGQLNLDDQLRVIDIITSEIIRSSRPLATRIIEILLVSGKYDLDEAKLKALIATATGEHGKVVLFDHHLPGLNESTIRELLNGIGGEYKRINSGKRPVFPLDDLHKHIAIHLEDKKVISSSRELPDKSEIKMVGRAV
jgi:energy-coupling factor transporter ATP-binding protein EcfA2